MESMYMMSFGSGGGGAPTTVLSLPRCMLRLAASSRRPAAPLSGDSARTNFLGGSGSVSSMARGLFGEFVAVTGWVGNGLGEFCKEGGFSTTIGMGGANCFGLAWVAGEIIGLIAIGLNESWEYL